MPFSDRQYDLYAILGDPALESPWLEQTWLRIASILDPLIQAARGPASVRSTQLKPGTGSPNQRAISFGRIGWNGDGHKKWTHRKSGSESPLFISSEVWAPSWFLCENEDRAPDCFLALRNEQPRPGTPVSFNPAVLLAVAHDQIGETVDLGKETAGQLAEILGALVRAHSRCPWGFNVSDVGLKNYLNPIGDLLASGGLFQSGSIRQHPLSLEMLRGQWSYF
jgi:hypothetical protein